METKPDLFITGELILTGRQSILYAWKRELNYLYVGSSKKGYSRFYNHEIIGLIEPLLKDDIIEIWYVTNTEELLRLEKLLINVLKPKYNKTHNGNNHIVTNTCPYCKGNMPIRLRKNQIYCSEKCRIKAWNERNPRINNIKELYFPDLPSDGTTL